jgi:hypothetical protein
MGANDFRPPPSVGGGDRRPVTAVRLICTVGEERSAVAKKNNILWLLAAGMAKSKTPAVRHLRYEVTNSSDAGTETSHYVDIARDLAAINRRMMAQGRIYSIKKITVVSRNTIAGVGYIETPVTGIPGIQLQQNAGFISVSAAPPSWSVINACKHGRTMFEKMKKKAMQTVEMKDGRYADFKIRALHGGTVAPTFLVPQDNGGNPLQLGTWEYSQFVSPDGTTGADFYTCHLLGDHAGSAGAYSSIGLVESYGNTRSTVSLDVPNSIQDSDDPLANLLDDGTVTDEIIQDASNWNDDPPYDINEYGGSADNMPRPIVMQQGTLGADGRVTLGGFEAVHGLLEFEVTSPIESDVYSILVELKEGSYKGIAAEAL